MHRSINKRFELLVTKVYNINIYGFLILVGIMGVTRLTHNEGYRQEQGCGLLRTSLKVSDILRLRVILSAVGLVSDNLLAIACFQPYLACPDMMSKLLGSIHKETL